MKRLIPIWLTAAFVCAQLHAADWPQWRGPGRDAVSQEKGLLQQWPDGGPKRVWLFQETGLGYAGPAVVGDTLFIMGTRENNEYLIAIDIKGPKELWAAEIGPVFRERRGDGPRGTPTVTADRVYTLGGQGTLICANRADGKIIWKKTMQELGGSVPNWGYTESVLVDDGKVYCTPGSRDQGAVAALDEKTGEVVWQSKDFAVPAHYTSMIVENHNGTRQVIQLTESLLGGVNAKDGKTLWTSRWPGRTAVVPTPIYHNGYVYVTSGYGVGCKLVKIGNNNPEDVYENKVMKNHHGGVVRIGKHIYGYSDQIGWVCQDFMTGEEVWAEEGKLDKGAIIAADNRLYCVGEDSGTVVLLAASPDGYKEHGRFTLSPQSEQRARQGKVWTHPVVANGKLYLRDQELLYCFDVKAN